MKVHCLKGLRGRVVVCLSLLLYAPPGVAQNPQYYKCESIAALFNRDEGPDGSKIFKLLYEKGEFQVTPKHTDALKDPENLCSSGCNVSISYGYGEPIKFETQVSNVLLGLQAVRKVENGLEAVESVYFKSGSDDVFIALAFVLLPGNDVIVRKNVFDHNTLKVAPITLSPPHRVPETQIGIVHGRRWEEHE